MTPAIALLTDFGLKDNFVGVMKGVILSICPAARIVDITHEVEPQAILHGALCLASSCRFFPDGTIFVAVVDPGVGGTRRAVAVRTEKAVFVAPDNGILGPALEGQKILEQVLLSNRKYFLSPISRTFHGRDVFAPAAAHIACGLPLSELGPPTETLEKWEIPKPVWKDDHWIGRVIYQDRFGNLVTNLPEKEFLEKFGENAVLAVGGKTIRGIRRSYDSVGEKDLMAIFGSFGYLEIACRNGSAADLLGLGEGERITVRKA